MSNFLFWSVARVKIKHCIRLKRITCLKWIAKKNCHINDDYHPRVTHQVISVLIIIQTNTNNFQVKFEAATNNHLITHPHMKSWARNLYLSELLYISSFTGSENDATAQGKCGRDDGIITKEMKIFEQSRKIM